MKNTWADTHGNEKVIDFPMKGEMVGLDGIAYTKFANSLKALTDSELISIPLDFCRSQNIEGEVFRNHIISVMSQQLVNEQKSSFMISSLPVDAKVAKFLLSLSFKFKSLGYSEKKLSSQDVKRRNWQLSWRKLGDGEQNYIWPLQNRCFEKR